MRGGWGYIMTNRPNGTLYTGRGEAAAGFERLAAEFRAVISGRRHTPAEDLQREGRDER